MKTKKTRVVSCEIGPLQAKELVVYKANNGLIFISDKDARKENLRAVFRDLGSFKNVFSVERVK